LDKKGIIKKFEKITIKDIEIYNILKQKDLCYDIINYIVNIDHENIIGNKFNIIPPIKNINKGTKYRLFKNILSELF
jgi:hypothetical protein